MTGLLKTSAHGRLTAVAVLTAALALCGVLAEASARGDSGSEWKREGRKVFPLDHTNPDIVKLGKRSFRAYLMGQGGIISAISTDGGRSFTLEGGMRISGGQHHALVKLPDGRLRMYYSHFGPPDPGDPNPAPPGSVLSAVSADGLTFKREPGVRLSPGAAGAPDSAGLIHLHVIRERGGGYRMYYDADAGGDVNWKGIRSATSDDGLAWQKERGFRIRSGMRGLGWAGLVWSPFAERRGKRYVLYFSAETDRNPKRRAGIYRAVSRNGRHFKVGKEPELGIDPRVKRPQQGPGGMTGLPQDAFIIHVGRAERLFFWQARQGTFTALRR